MQTATNTQVITHDVPSRLGGFTSLAPVAGRIFIATIFLWSGIGKIGGFAGTAAYMSAMGVPLVQLALVATIVIEVGGALMLILGWQARLGAAALLLWMIPVTLIFHAFWAVPADQVQMQMIQFFKNVGLMGAMLLIIGNGAGPYGIDKQ